MKRISKNVFFLFVVLCLLCSTMLAGCSGADADADAGSTTGTAVELTYTDSFGIVDYGNDVKLVTDAEGTQFLLVPEGQEVPEIADAEGATVISTPLKQVVYCSSTQVSLLKCFFSTEDDWNSIAGVTVQADQWYIDEVTAGMESGDITFVGGDGMGEPDFEIVQSLNPDMVVVYTGDYGMQTTLAKMDELGIPCMVVNDYLEPDDMGRLEWSRFLAAFYNKDDEAASYMADQEALLAEIKADVADLDSPKVVWASIYSGSVYAPNAGSYVAKQIENAGGDYVFSDLNPDQGGSSQLTLEEFYDKAKDADIFIYSTSSAWMPSVATLLETAPILEDFKSIEDGEIYCFDAAYYMNLEKTVDGVKDLASLFHEDLYTGRVLVMYEKLQ